jgi:2,3-bisphosphoglycerate-dependent phosphoglycerate mutase
VRTNSAPKTVYFVRHCQAAGQEPDAPLTPAGAAQAAILADFLAPFPIDRILSSPFRRARDSIAPFAARRCLPVETDERLIERVLTTASLPDWRAHLRASFGDLDYCLPGGESSRTAFARATAVLDDLRHHPATTTVVVTHGNLLALLLRHCDDRVGYAAWEALTNPDIYVAALVEPIKPARRIWK